MCRMTASHKCYRPNLHATPPISAVQGCTAPFTFTHPQATIEPLYYCISLPLMIERRMFLPINRSLAPTPRHNMEMAQHTWWLQRSQLNIFRPLLVFSRWSLEIFLPLCSIMMFRSTSCSVSMGYLNYSTQPQQASQGSFWCTLAWRKHRLAASQPRSGDAGSNRAASGGKILGLLDLHTSQSEFVRASVTTLRLAFEPRDCSN